MKRLILILMAFLLFFSNCKTIEYEDPAYLEIMRPPVWAQGYWYYYDDTNAVKGFRFTMDNGFKVAYDSDLNVLSEISFKRNLPRHWLKENSTDTTYSLSGGWRGSPYPEEWYYFFYVSTNELDYARERSGYSATHMKRLN